MEVEAILAAQDRVTGPLKSVERAAGGTSRAVEGAERATESLSRGFESLKTKAEILGATIGVGLGLREFKEMFVDVNSQIEDATRNLGGMIGGLYQFAGANTPAQNLAMSMQRSKEMMEDFEESATRTGIPARVLADTARAMAPGMAATRTSTKELVGITKQVAYLSKMVGADTANSAFAMSEFLQYGMAARNPLMMQLGLAGRVGKQYDTIDKRLKLIQSKMKQFGVTEESLRKSETFSDKVARVRAQMELIAERAGRPLFDKASEAASRLADWLDKNQDKVKAIEGEVVDKLVGGFELAVGGARYLADHLEQVKATVEAIAVAWTAIKVGKAMSSFGQGFSSIAASAGGDFAKAAGSKLQSFLAGAGMLAQAAGIGWAVGTAIDGYLQKTDWWKKVWSPGKSTPEILADQAESKRASAEKRQIASARSMLQDQMKYLHLTGAQAYQRLLGTETIRRGGRLGYEGEQFGKGILGMAARELGIGPGRVPAPPAGPKMPGDRGRDQMNQNFYNALFDIMQQFAPGFDPDRVAVAFTADLAALGDKRTQSALHPLHVAT